MFLFTLFSFLTFFFTTSIAAPSAPSLDSRNVNTTTLPTAGVLTQIPSTSFTNPTNASLWIYVPKNISTTPALLVAIHYCTGTGEAFYKHTQYGTLAERYGYIVIYPSSPNAGTCWDVSSKASLSNGGKGDSGSIVGMVKWTLGQYPKIDKEKVFVVGESSGGMMTNILASAYPSLFTAAIVYAGVPAGCFASSNPLGVNWWNSTCSAGKSIATPSRWAEIAKAMGPTNYTGARPRMMIYHGAKDATLNPVNFEEELKQWCGVLGYDYSKPSAKVEAVPSAGHVMTTWGTGLRGVMGANEPHSLMLFPEKDMEWFGLK